MNYKYYILLLGLLILGFKATSQSYNKYCLYAQYATKAYQEDKYTKAISLMDSALTLCPDKANTFENWYNLSLFYKTLEKQDHDVKNREKALEAVLKAKELDIDGEYSTIINKSIRGIAIRYYNEAKFIANDTSGHFEGALDKYNRYKSIMLLTTQNTDFKQQDIDFYGFLAGRHQLKYDNNKNLYANHLDSTIHYYKAIIAIDSSLSSPYEELGTIYFNLAVDIINSLSIESDLEELMMADEKKANLALKAIPYFEKANELAPDNGKIIYALAGCYQLIKEDDKVEHYLKLLKEKDPEYYNEIYITSENSSN